MHDWLFNPVRGWTRPVPPPCPSWAHFSPRRCSRRVRSGRPRTSPRHATRGWTRRHREARRDDAPTAPRPSDSTGDRRVTMKGRTMIDGSHQSALRKSGARRRGRVRARHDDCPGPGRHGVGTAQGHPASAPAASAVLSQRELEVLHLVATGASDRGIADQLFLSRRTINCHVGNILSKLAVATRTAAVVTAARTGLL
jgi:DNA-binding CsgD family transcriptional regulator